MTASDVRNCEGARPTTARLLRCLHAWAIQVADPLRFWNGLRRYSRYLADWRAYARLPGAEAIHLIDTVPQIHDRSTTTVVDTHYFYANGWAARLIGAAQPVWHVDVASHTTFVNLLGAIVPVIFLDYRPLYARMRGLRCVGGNILQLPFADNSIRSLSCLHAAEHIGLGRYGEPLDVQGTLKAARELARVLAPSGHLYFALPVGQTRLCFNAHRIHAAETIRTYFSNLELVEFSGVHDDGRFVERVALTEFYDSEYACGMFWFRKPG